MIIIITEKSYALKTIKLLYFAVPEGPLKNYVTKWNALIAIVSFSGCRREVFAV